jgi:uncharacterized protein YbcI
VSPTTAALDISAEVAGIHAAAYERQYERVSTLLDEDLAMCVLRIELSPAEKVLISHRHREAVRDQRQAFEHTLAPALTAAVERATGRTVTTFHTNTLLDPDLTLLIFMFAAAGGLPATEPLAA